ncbi:MAG TPA: gluconokinase [Candidatus Acidoferrales bacterium]|nr:gluconokinase [Candidatus Acidoferrales bacterium]
MVVILMGVSGSGKTVAGQALAAKLGWAFEDADGWHSAANVAKMRSGIPLTDKDREPWLSLLNHAIRGWIANGTNTVLACSALTKRYREALRAGSEHSACLRFVYLRGTYEQIDRRLRQRSGHFMPESLLRSQFETLEEPGPEEAVAVDAAMPVPNVVDTIIAALALEDASRGRPASGN